MGAVGNFSTSVANGDAPIASGPILSPTIMEIKRKSTKQAVREVRVLKRTFPGVRFKFRKMEFSTDELTEGAHVWTKDDGKKQENQASAEVKSK